MAALHLMPKKKKKKIGVIFHGGVSFLTTTQRCCIQRTVCREEEDLHSNMDLICKPRSKSIVWLYFGLKADEKGQPLNSGEAVCRLCRKIVLAKGGNTTNLRSHLRRRHRADLFETTSTPTTAALFEAQGDLPPNSALSMREL